MIAMGSVSYLIARLKNGSASAFEGLMGRYYSRQVRQARRRLHSAPAGIQDAEDVAAVAFWKLWQGVIQRRAVGTFLSDTTSILKVLATLTRDQVNRAGRHALANCRDCRRTVALPDRNEAGPTIHELATNPWPGFVGAIESREEVAGLTALLPTDRHRTLVRRVIEGRGLHEIATELQCSVRTVQRLYAEIADIWRSPPGSTPIEAK
jgi:DNA-directed RNA polymerase specialized sigma24 family protein